MHTIDTSNAMKAKPKVSLIICVFLIAGLVADTIPHPRLGPGLLASTLDFFRSQLSAEKVTQS
jgi:hypothetical protein